MTTATNTVVVVEPSGIAIVCAWCLSPGQLAELNRTYRVSHSLCPLCFARMEAAAA